MVGYFFFLIVEQTQICSRRLFELADCSCLGMLGWWELVGDLDSSEHEIAC